jgi:hypothetical protein
MQEQLLKNSHDIYIGQKVKVVDDDVMELFHACHPDAEEDYIFGYIKDIDGEDVYIKCEIPYETNDGKLEYANVSGWNLNFSVKC